LFQNILRIWHVHAKSGIAAASTADTTSATGATSAPIAIIPTTTTIHNNECTPDNSNPRHCVGIAGAKAHFRRQDRLHHPLFYESRAHRVHHLRY
jgi:hypothetical protein